MKAPRALFLSLLALPALAQEPPQDTRLRVWAGDIDAWDEAGTKVMFLTGQVRVQRADVELTAARAMVWQGKGGVDEMYAEGNVVFRQGKQTMRAERLYFNFARQKAFIVDLRLTGASKDFEGQRFYVSAKEARLLAGGVWVADDLSLSTCPYGVPHYHVAIERARLIGKGEPDAKSPYHIWPYQDWDFHVEDVRPELMGAPLLFFPGLVLGSWMKEFPLRSVAYGRTSRFGHFALSEWGFRVKLKDEEGKPRTWGDVKAELDWREKRGGAYGLDVAYKWGGYTGLIDTYLLYDQGRDPERIDFDQRLDAVEPLRREYRGKARVFHRHDLDPNWRYEVEAYYVSDRTLREEFFPREFREDKEPESAFYLRWRDGNAGAYLYERHRLNDFQNQDEFLPRADFHLQHQPVVPSLADNLYLTHRSDAVRIRRRFDEELHVRSVDTWRFDLTNELSMPWDLGPFQVSPFVQSRLTLFEDDLEGESELRSLWTAGGRWTTQIHGSNAELGWDLVGLRGLRHVAELEARYANTVDSNLESSDVFPYEPVDPLGEFEELGLELRQRLLTRGADGKPFEFLSGWVGIEYYPDSDRDSVGPREDNVEAPFGHLLLASDPMTGAYERRHWSNLQYRLRFSPRSFFAISGGGEYNPVSHHEEVREFSATLTPFEALSVGVSQTFVREITNAYSAGVSVKLAEKWSGAALVQYDFMTEDYLTQSLVVSRDYHDFLLQAVVERDFGRDERRFYVTFVPKFLGLGRMTGRTGPKQDGY
jgi:lipopolysaccharide export system protein LptA